MDTNDTDVFDEVEEETKVEVEAEVESEAEKGEKEEPEAKAEEEAKEETPASKDEGSEVTGLKAAVKAERGRRQAAEAKLRERPDPVTDPEGYDDYLKSNSASDRLTDRINLTQDLMRDMHEDFDKYQGVFMGLVSEENEDGSLSITDNQLLAKFNASANPAKFAYQHAKEHERNLERSAPDFESKMEERITKDLLARLKIDPTELPNLTNAAASLKNDVEVDDKSKDVIDVFDD